MATITINRSGRTNQPPNQTGWVNITVPYNSVYTFTLADFTTNTSPPYSDPEGDALRAIQFKVLPITGTIRLDGVAINIDEEILASEISAGDLTYLPATIEDGYSDGNSEFVVSDVGSFQYYSGKGQVILNVETNINQPPSSVGNGQLDIDRGEIVQFTRAMLTTGLDPSYQDPENDPALSLKIDALPLAGTIKLDGTPVFVGQVILFTEIDAGNLIYENSEINQGADGFEFSIADSGSGEHVG